MAEVIWIFTICLYIRHHFAQIVIFAKPIETTEIVRVLFEATLMYIQSVSSITKNEYKTMVTEQLPVEFKKEALALYEQIKLEGVAAGLEKGKKEVIQTILQKHPECTDIQIAELLDVPVAWVQEVRSLNAAS